MPVKRRSRIAERREKLDGGVTYAEWKSRYADITDELKPYWTGNSYQTLTHTSASVGTCKTFSELKTYWADNYNVKLSDSISGLHFESVKSACSGVEKVLKEFPPAAGYLKEFSLFETGIMSTVRKKGIINFNPKYFFDGEKIIGEVSAGVQSGYYPKNMTIEGVGAHEAGHILEDWLIAKNGGGAEAVIKRTFAEKTVKTAYLKVLSTFRTAKEVRTLDQLMEEIGEYATKNMSECLATAVCDYITNKINSNILSQEIWSILKKELE